MDWYIICGSCYPALGSSGPLGLSMIEIYSRWSLLVLVELWVLLGLGISLLVHLLHVYWTFSPACRSSHILPVMTYFLATIRGIFISAAVAQIVSTPSAISWFFVVWPSRLILALTLIFKASALWADAFYKSKCPYVCVFGFYSPTFNEPNY